MLEDDYDTRFDENSGVEWYDVEVEPGVFWSVYDYEDGDVSVVDQYRTPVSDILVREYSEILSLATGLDFG